MLKKNVKKMQMECMNHSPELSLTRVFGFAGTPLKLFWRGKQKRDAERDFARQQNCS